MLEKIKDFSVNPITLSSSAFDTGTLTATPAIANKVNTLSLGLIQLGFDVRALSKHDENTTNAHAQQRLKEIHDAATLLHMQWERANQLKDKDTEFAAARLFNGLTSAARALQKQHRLVDTSHVAGLEEIISDFVKKERIDSLKKIADAVGQAAQERSHEIAWLWVVLPTFVVQHYGRILLGKVQTGDSRYPAFIMQPTFKKGVAPQFHTHGQNWAIATPLGDSKKGDNYHVNTLLKLNSRENAFPLRLLPKGRAVYDTQQVVVIPPRIIHSISKARREKQYFPSLNELAQYNTLRLRSVIEEHRFGELSCLHVYFPDPTLIRNLENAPFLKEDPRFFMENDMIVFDHFTKPPCIWAGGGGAWAKRMIQFGTAGDHCGICFQENDSRRNNLDPRVVYDWFVQQPPAPDIQVYNKKI